MPWENRSLYSMKIQSISNTMSFKSNYTSDDLYRLEQKLDSLQASMDRNDLNSFYKDLPKERRMPMPLGVPPYAMGGMMGMPFGPMGMPPRGPMGMPGMIPGMPMGMPPGGMYGAPMEMPGGMPRTAGSRLSGQPCQDIYCPRR